MSTAVADPAVRDWRQTLVDRPAVALTGVLLLLYVITGLFAPGMFTFNGVRSTLLLACPLAILAASQTICMLTGGIDLSTVMTANFAAYVAANQSGQGPVVALGLALIPALMLGLGWDPNYAEVARGVIIIVVVMIGGLLQIPRRSR